MSILPVLGPVFEYEWLTGSRRWQVDAARSLIVAATARTVCVDRARGTLDAKPVSVALSNLLGASLVHGVDHRRDFGVWHGDCNMSRW